MKAIATGVCGVTIGLLVGWQIGEISGYKVAKAKLDMRDAYVAQKMRGANVCLWVEKMNNDYCRQHKQ